MELRPLRPGEVYVIDTTRPRKDKWIWTKGTFDRYAVSDPDRFKIVSDRKVVIQDKTIEVQDVPQYKVPRIEYKGKLEARKKKDNKK